MSRVCPHNHCVDCEVSECDRCGWNPKVAKARVEDMMRKLSDSKLYKIPFTGYCEVWADSAEEAAQKADDGQTFFIDFDFGEPACLTKEESL